MSVGVFRCVKLDVLGMLEVIGADVPRVVSQMEEFFFIHEVFLSGKDGAAILWGLGVAAAIY